MSGRPGFTFDYGRQQQLYFGLVLFLCFNDISIFVGYLMPNPPLWKNGSGTIQLTACEGYSLIRTSDTRHRALLGFGFPIQTNAICHPHGRVPSGWYWAFRHTRLVPEDHLLGQYLLRHCLAPEALPISECPHDQAFLAHATNESRFMRGLYYKTALCHILTWWDVR